MSDSSVIYDRYLEETFRRQGAAESGADPTFGPLPATIDAQALRNIKFGITARAEDSITKTIIYGIREDNDRQQPAIRIIDDDQMLEAMKSLRLLAWWLSKSQFLSAIHRYDAFSVVRLTIGLEF